MAAASLVIRRPGLDGGADTARGNVIGMLCLTHRKSGGFNAEDAPWVQSFAAQLVVALENANLYAQVVRVNEHLTHVKEERVTAPVAN